MSDLLQPTRQARSRATQARILDATQALLRTEHFEDISIRQIVRQANTSIGSFYARFRDKDALLSVLSARHESRLAKRVRRLEAAVTAARSLDEVAVLIAAHIVKTYGEIPNLSRALFEYVTRAPDSQRSRIYSEKRMAQYGFLLEALLTFRDEIGHADPDRAVQLALYFVAVTCRNRLFYPLYPQTRTLKLSRRELTAETARMMTGYLRA